MDELNGLAFAMPEEDSPGNQPNPLCPDGGGPHNMSWIGFTAEEGEYTIQVSGSNCSGSTTGEEGRQFGIYTDCTFVETIYCAPECNLDTISISNNLLVAGQTYYMFIDGCFGSFCDVTVEIIGDYGGPVSVSDPVIEYSEKSKIIVYPNPAKDRLFIKSDEAMDEIMVFNTSAQLLMHHKLGKHEQIIEMDVNGLVPGLYLTQIRVGDRSYYSKLTIGK